MKIWFWDSSLIMKPITRRLVDGNMFILGDISNTDCAHYQASTNST